MRRPPTSGGASLEWWADTVAGAAEPSVVLDSDGVVVACSDACRELFGAVDGEEWIGRGLLDVLTLVDLTAAAAPLASWETERVPPLLALAVGGLARAVMRVRLAHGVATVDAVATPLWDEAAVVGSLTFLHPIQTAVSGETRSRSRGWFPDRGSSA